ncbi:MAG: TRL-like family protein [Puniceicoccales bacterium]|jgi:hypothetical protein|nr:TRL-like family protein [Puniceicoccales bacterium]
MKKVLIALPALAAAAFFTGCAAPEHYGVLFSNSTHPRQVTDNALGSKKGEAKITNILGIVEGDSGIKAAASNGGITKIGAVDVRIKNYLGVYSETTTVVYGE